MYNSFTGVGRLTRTPELKFSTSGVGVCNFSIACDRGYKKEGQQNVDFVNVRVLGKLAENCATYLDKGKLALVTGPLHIENYENKDGEKKLAVYVLANTVKFLSPKGESQQMSGTIDLDSISTECGVDQDLPF